MPPADPSQDPTPLGPGADEPLLDADDVDEYELEESDDEQETVHQKFAREQMQAAAESLDVDKFYSDYERGVELEGLMQDFKFQFQIRHLMLFTAGLALLLSLWKLANFAAVLLITVVVLAGAHVYIAHREKKRQEELLAQRERVVRAMRNQQAGESEEHPPEIEEAIEEIRDGDGFKLQFSMKQVMIAMTVACVLLAVCSLLPIKLIAVVFGVLAVVGIAAHAAGVDAPQPVVLGWWMILAAYIVLSIVQQAVGGG